jgi:hypothetical protein
MSLAQPLWKVLVAMPGLKASDRPPSIEAINGRGAHDSLTPVTDHSVWKANDFRDGSWIVSLSEDHTQEIEAAIGATIHAHEGRFGRARAQFLLWIPLQSCG